ncbi:Translocating chain-associated membrane protein 1-like 1 [Varanus komodoensis]|uniref:translocating chain-associated membrane protein 1-like 1 n=1 Tax=Varanus komodoensis TaxID=61221 RepID=UPI001CF7B508|nr:translocating chain-associated membrane protein 1-like 1 [Varanus komodoensis]KAF7240927.1 Translocating chain-associated membrane protein 1-like 1 [Varanus komodoensis]
MGLRKKNKSPPVLSHEFVIQNHADAVSCLAMGLLLGLMFEVTAKYAIMFITVQYNVTYTTDDRPEPVHFYEYGPKDVATIFFYMLIAIILHAVIQEYILDKINRRLHLSKTKHSKFNESGQLAFFYLCSFVWGASILSAEEFTTNPTLLWKDYPHSHMFFQVKFFYICQIAYWLHTLPELYFQKIRKEDIPRQLQYICLYISHISGAYILNLQRLGLILLVPHYLVELIFHASRLFYFSDENKQKGFTLWALLFVMARLLTLTLSVLTFGFGLATAENPGFSIAEGNFNILTIRISCLAAICLTQAWMMWKFINFQLKKWREHIQNQIPKKKTNIKVKSTKKESCRPNFVNGAVKFEEGMSPRKRKSKFL